MNPNRTQATAAMPVITKLSPSQRRQNDEEYPKKRNNAEGKQGPIARQAAVVMPRNALHENGPAILRKKYMKGNTPRGVLTQGLFVLKSCKDHRPPLDFTPGYKSFRQKLQRTVGQTQRTSRYMT